jgi:hypothetical protein
VAAAERASVEERATGEPAESVPVPEARSERVRRLSVLSALLAALLGSVVTSQVQSMYSGSNHGFRVRDATEDAAAGPMQSSRGREAGSTPPELVVTFG